MGTREGGSHRMKSAGTLDAFWAVFPSDGLRKMEHQGDGWDGECLGAALQLWTPGTECRGCTRQGRPCPSTVGAQGRVCVSHIKHTREKWSHAMVSNYTIGVVSPEKARESHSPMQVWI